MPRDRRPRAILFDLDDTLFDHSACTFAALDALAAVEAELSRCSVDDLRRLYGEALERAHERLLSGELTLAESRIVRFQQFFEEAAGVRIGRERAASCAAAYRRAYEAAWRPVPGAPELLDRLRSRARIGVVSNNLLAEQEAKLRALGFHGAVEALVVSEEVGCAKPAPRIFEVALERLGCGADDAVMVGNSWPHDVCGALAAGIRPVWFNRLGHRRPDDTPVEELGAFEPADEVCRRLIGPDAQTSRSGAIEASGPAIPARGDRPGGPPPAARRPARDGSG